MIIGCALAVLAIVLVGPGPMWVGRWSFLHRIPRAAIVLWQAGTVAALVSIVGAGVLFGVELLTGRLSTLTGRLVAGLVILFALNVVARLTWALVTVVRATGVRRARHRRLVDLLAEVGSHPTLPSVRVLAAESPMAYCLPALRDSRVVVSQGTLQRLDPDALTAVLLHEKAHLRARHDVVLDTFTALHRAFPFLVRSQVPLREARLLVEMLADDAARRTAGGPALARALVAMVDAEAPPDALGVTGAPRDESTSGITQRLQRLTESERSTRLLAVAVYLLAGVLVVAPLCLLVVGFGSP